MHAAPLGGLTPAEFLESYWQKKPLLIRDALPGFRSPLAPEELAGLACEEGVESRLVLEQGDARPWELRHGPFAEEDFLALPETHWTLLVQGVDRLIPEVEALLDNFRFLPSWRIDDVMVSYAPAHGGVGAHIDSYDVFLLQGLGRRRWRIGAAPVEEETLVPDLDVRVLAGFEADEEYVLGPGDMLYLPPRVAHEGVALGDCMTYSIGLRAPSERELLGSFLQDALTRPSADALYADPDLTPAEHPAEIRPEALARIRELLQSALSDEDAIADWFGRFVTERREALPPTQPPAPDDLAEAVRQGAALTRSPGAQLAFVEKGGAATLFADGEAHPLGDGLAFAAPLLTGRRALPAEALRPHLGTPGFAELLADLVEAGALEIASEDGAR